MSMIELSRRAAHEALRVRAKAKIGLNQSFCVIDLAGTLGVEVQFVDLTSLEGAYIKDSPKILLSAFRPDGRTRFTCGHELGHHIFGHGDHFDKLVEIAGTVEAKNGELICDIFSGLLLMPLSLIRHGFKTRGCNISSLEPMDILRMASWIGVGYETLIKHLFCGLKLITKEAHDKLSKVKIARIKEELIGKRTAKNLIVLDSHWAGRPVDLAVGDFFISPNKIICEQDNIHVFIHKENYIAEAIKPGVIQFLADDNGFVGRIKRAEYTGRAKFRHLEED